MTTMVDMAPLTHAGSELKLSTDELEHLEAIGVFPDDAVEACATDVSIVRDLRARLAENSDEVRTSACFQAAKESIKSVIYMSFPMFATEEETEQKNVAVET